MAGMSSAADVQALLSSVEMKDDRFVELLTKLIDNVDTLQNNPSQVSVARFQALSYVSWRALAVRAHAPSLL